MRSRSRENVASNNRLDVFDDRGLSSPSEGSFHTARPANVVNTSGGSSNDSTANEGSSSGMPPLPDDRRIDWTALVDTATRAIHSSGSESGASTAGSGGKQKSTVLLNNTDDKELVRRTKKELLEQQAAANR